MTSALDDLVVLELPPREEWMDDALCAQTDPELFFPDKGGSTREAKDICRACPVVDQCLTWALEHPQRYGIWGGTSERDRRKITTARAKGTAA